MKKAKEKESQRAHRELSIPRSNPVGHIGAEITRQLEVHPIRNNKVCIEEANLGSKNLSAKR